MEVRGASGGCGLDGFLIAPGRSLTPRRGRQRYQLRMDLVFLLVLCGFFALSWGLVRLCARLAP